MRVVRVALVCAVFVSGLGLGQAAAVETIYTNAKVYTVDEALPWAEAVAIDEGKFVAVGKAGEVAALATDETRIIDLKGRVVLPGLVDEHIHVDMMSENTMNVTFEPTHDYEAFKATIAEFLKRRPDAKWVYGGNLDWLKTDGQPIDAFGQPSHKSTLDAIVSDRPAFFWDIGAHAALVNSKLLEVYGITRDTEPPEGGAYDKDSNGELTGVVRETAAGELWEAFNEDRPSLKEIAYEGVVPVVQQLNSHGITSFTDAGTREFYVSAYGLLDEADDLNIRVFAYITDPSDWQSEEMKKGAARAIENRDTYSTRRVQIGGVKYILDGSAGGQTLVLVDPFVGTDYRGPWRNPPEDFLEKIVRYDAQGLTVKTHAVGDGAIRKVLDGIALTRKQGSTLRHSVAHAGFVNPADRSRFAELEANAELSPYFWYPTPANEVIREELGEERLGWAWPVRILVESGAPYSFGSDWPVTPPNPWPAIEALITRRDPGSGPDAPAFNAAFGISLEQALRGYTMGGARAQYMEDVIGSITVGKSADLIVLDQDIFEVDVTRISETRVLQTVLEGKVVYAAE
ncbi:MAG: amidohydrolase [Myxococcota bacterium]|nr:amidohydrolase [Myxococcota bacterium]